MIKNDIEQSIRSALERLQFPSKDIGLETPAKAEFGDYSSNIAMQLAKELKKNPYDVAEEIKNNLPANNDIEKVEVVRPGFINFYISHSYLLQNAKQFNQKPVYRQFRLGTEGKVAFEFSHPNTHKLFHIGHLRNITTGETLVRIFEVLGNTVLRFNYQGDVGLHIAKCIWRIKQLINVQGDKVFADKTNTEKIKLLGEAYAAGNAAYESDEKAKAEIIEINRKIYLEDPETRKLWQETRQWSLDYFDSIYKRVYTHFDRLYFESEMPKRALEIVEEAVKRDILKKSEGAIVFDGKPYGLDTRVFVNAIGIPTYEGKELALAEKEFTEHGTLDKLIHVLGGEQTSFSSVTFKVQALLNPDLYQGKQYHLVYGWVKLKHGKMSSRSGNVVQGAWLLDEAKKQILEKFKCEDDTAETLAVGAIKYSFLKNGTQNETAFDFDESISLDGNSGPYINYTYVRTQSVLKKAGSNGAAIMSSLSSEELGLLHHFHKFPEIVYLAAQNYAPNTIANYLFELAQKFNLFYQKNQILNAENSQRDLRLFITQHTGYLIKTGLNLLGIKTVEKM